MSTSPNYLPVRDDWLASYDEDVLEPSLPIVDSHHHLYDRPGLRYLLDEYLDDLRGGHNVRASVFVQARAMLRADAHPDVQAIGETEFVNGVAAMSASGLYGKTRVCAGIVGYADLTLGRAVRPILERLIMAGGGLTVEGGRFCGIRQTLCWDPDTPLLNPAYKTTPTMMESAPFRDGFAQLAPLGLSFDAWAFFHQLTSIAKLARAFPEIQIVLNHCGGIIRIRDYADQPDIYDRWRAGISEVASCPNVMIKLSGLGMRLGGFGLENLPSAPGSVEIAEAWKPWVDYCVDAFGANRCMYGSNFPVDKGSYGLKIGINALKRLVSGASSEERDDIFWRSAKRFYRLPDSLF
jgi:predicted TIM-barrel fold metal-dependent hydrolase